MRAAFGLGLMMVVTLAPPLSAQAPLSIIDWLETDEIAPLGTEPPVSLTGLQPRIETQPLEAPRKPVGLVPASVTGLPVDVWMNSRPDDLVRLIVDAPVAGHPALQSLLYSLLLSEAIPPGNPRGAGALMLARIDALLTLGAIDPAKALIEQAGPTSSPEIFARWSDTAFLTGSEDEICAVLAQMPHLSPDRETLIFCTARLGDPDGASLLFETSLALDDLDPRVAPVLDRFLHPELFEDAAPLPQARAPSALSFRLFEAIGERLPTASLPRRFATADLRDVAGWKAQLEAAERLARTGAIASNTLLGLYTERLPAASGGVWDRVAAVQRFETALKTRSADALSKTLPDAWSAMRDAGLSVPFADLFAAALAQVALPQGLSRRHALEMVLLSSDYETLSRGFEAQNPHEAFWIALAQGSPQTVLAPSALSETIAAGFAAPADLPGNLSADRLGETVLEAIHLFDRGAAGNLRDLQDAIAVFRSLGLEDVARRASLQLLIAREG